MDEIRKAGDYTITQSITIGSKEFVVGEDFKNKDGLFYMIGEYEDVFGVVSYDILELGEQMKSIGLLIMLDNIMNRVIENRKKGKYTRVYIDEAHLFFKNQYSADFLLKAWKRFRKYGGLLTGITQNISDCLLNETARGMLSNSEFLLMLNQSPSDRKDLSELLNISDTQMSYITNAGAGRGLIKVGGSIVPFVNDFPTDTELYKLMSTKPGEG